MLKPTILHIHRPLLLILLASRVGLSVAQSTPPNPLRMPTSRRQPWPSLRELPNLSHGSASTGLGGLSGKSPFAASRNVLRGGLGVGELRVKSAESGEVIRFGYRVLDAEKAKAFNDKKKEPSQIDLGAAAKYQKQKQLAAVRETTEYKEAYAWISDEPGKLQKDKAVMACSASREGATSEPLDWKRGAGTTKKRPAIYRHGET